MISRAARRFIFLLILAGAGLAVMVFVMSDYDCAIMSASDPSGRVEAAIKSIQKQELDKTAQYFTPPAASKMTNRLINYYSACDKIEIKDIKTYLVSEDALVARVQAEYDVVCYSGSTFMVDHYAKRVKMINNDGTWLIDEAL